MSGDSIEVESESVDSVLPSFETSDQRSESNSIPVGSGDVFECQSNSGNFVGSAELYDAEVRLFLPDGGAGTDWWLLARRGHVSLAIRRITFYPYSWYSSCISFECS